MVNAVLVGASSPVVNSKMVDKNNEKILMLFSDLDGTLIHYPKSIAKDAPQILKLPPSSTGMIGVISQNTLSLGSEVRKREIKLFLVSGMRTKTLLKRLPYLPRADAYCVEGGGRIFYPQEEDYSDCEFTVIPEKFDGAKEDEMKPFGLAEDTMWRQMMESYTGKFDETTPVADRDGVLWSFAQHLIGKGFVLDTNGYSSCFRVNKKHQTIVSGDDFEALRDGRIATFSGLETSVNLNCIDVYPSISGKKNCCQYLAEKFFPEAIKATLLSSHAVCLCDDDNDIEMALSCKHAYIPSVSSLSMATIIEENPSHFTQTGVDDNEGSLSMTNASDKALSIILDRLAAS